MRKKLVNKTDEIFCEEYLLVGDATRAFRAAYNCHGMSSKEISSKAHSTLRSPLIVERLKELRVKLAENINFGRFQILEILKRIALADPSELARIERVNCRYCRGIGHAYQFTEPEYLAKVELAANTSKPLPEIPLGGFGYNKTLPPVKECPVCCGDGESTYVIEDVNKLTPDARLLFAGVKPVGAGQYQILMRDQDAALMTLAKFFGIVASDDKSVSKNLEFAAVASDPLQASQIYTKIMGQ